MAALKYTLFLSEILLDQYFKMYINVNCSKNIDLVTTFLK